ncbi:TrkH family potassium uptake protein [Oceanibacterium hippocampi]|uniref:Trk system potassium uptake protein n=1 Tax=Oceanibacterium hippocampi TaxID=745714 RepID=A0A1Y5RUH5_9PROT|nr:TrkH family potassium uptake protein [Oceanibacterium hippocampi]SLN25652.1 Trk system potassium uptake protein TrkH [Oceanibacterium hippocampi]
MGVPTDVIDYRPVLMVAGLLVATLGVFMMIPAIVDLFAGHADWQVFAGSAIVTVFVGIGLFLSNRAELTEVGLREAFILTTVVWIILPAFAAVPFNFSELNMSYTDAFFEAMSGLTTTGATVITGLDGAPPGLLIWRALLQWLGGVGVVVMAIAVLPILQVGGMQLFRMESSENSPDKVMPRTTQIVAAIGSIYLLLTITCAISLWLAGMSVFDAVAHSMTAISTAGFSTHDLSIGHFDSAAIDWIVTLFMALGALPFLLYFRAVQGQPVALLRDSQVRWFLGILGLFIAAMALLQILRHGTGVADALRYAAFNVTSVMTGTGYATTDYGLWGGFAVCAFFFIMFIGGCAGSTSCGIKIFRFQVIFETARMQMLQLWQPNRIVIPHYNGRPLPDTAIESVMSFLFLFLLSFSLLTLALTALGLDFVTAVSGAATAIANVGPGLGDIIGPSGNFQPLPDTAKWLLSGGMLIGRLELFTVLVLFTRRFWQI